MGRGRACVRCREVHEDDDFHSVIIEGKWRFGVQLAPNHIPPEWPDGAQQEEGHQVYADPAGHPFCLGWHSNVPAVHDFGASQG